jgi:hypothetical protein
MKNAGFVLSHEPTTEERNLINKRLKIEDIERFWDGEGLTIFWDNNFTNGDLNGLISKVFTDAETINNI